MKKLIAILAFVAIAAASYATITNTGDGIAGTGAGGTQPYNISLVVQDRFDGDRNPIVYCAINGKLWHVNPPSKYSSAYCKLYEMGVGGKWVQYGTIAAKTADGKAFLSGGIFINRKTWRVIAFKAIPFYTPNPMPTVKVSQLITIFMWDTTLGAYVRRRDLDIGTIYDPAFMSGTVYLNDHYQIVGGTFDGRPIDLGTAILIPVPYVPAPEGGAKNLPIMPAKMF